MPSYAQDIRQRFSQLSQTFPGYERVLTQILFALIAREHVLLYSKPGRAKTQIAKSIFDIFAGAPVFITQLTRDMSKDSIFGNIIADDLLKDGREVYNLKGGIVDCVFAYLDEFFDAPDEVLRSLLNVMHEREFHTKDMGTVKSPLHTIIATTNFMRLNEAREAIFDRFMCKAVIQGIDGLADSMRVSDTYLTYSGKSVDLEPIDYEELSKLADKVARSEEDGGVIISKGMRLLHIMLVKEFQRRRTEQAFAQWKLENPNAVDDPTMLDVDVPDISPRTMVKLFDFSRAAAVLEDRDYVTQEDQQALIYGLAIIGDESGDELIWTQVCKDLLGMNRKQLEKLEALGVLAEEVAQLKNERHVVDTVTFEVFGVRYTLASLKSQSTWSKLVGTKHPLLDLAISMLQDEVRHLSDPRPVGFDLEKGW